jgi:cold shock CspA family protein
MAAIEVARGPAADGTLVGTVAAFDEAGGYGTVMADLPAARWFFHCTAIADGSRTIAVGAAVRFEVAPGRMGRFEATNLRALTTAGSVRTGGAAAR